MTIRSLLQEAKDKALDFYDAYPRQCQVGLAILVAFAAGYFLG